MPPEIITYTMEMFLEDHRRYSALASQPTDALGVTNSSSQNAGDAVVKKEEDNEDEVSNDGDDRDAMAAQSGDSSKTESEQHAAPVVVVNQNEVINEASNVAKEKVAKEDVSEHAAEISEPPEGAQSTVVANADSIVHTSLKPQTRSSVSATEINRDEKKNDQQLCLAIQKQPTPPKPKNRNLNLKKSSTAQQAANSVSAKERTFKKETPSESVQPNQPKPAAVTTRSGRVVKRPSTLVEEANEPTQTQSSPAKKRSKNFSSKPSVTITNDLIGEKMQEDEPICQQCGRFFANLTALKLHQQAVHQAERPFKCTDCKWAFRASWELEEHRVVHSGVKPFRCSTCSAAFYKRGNLVAHQRVHSDERPFSCPLCPRAFKHRQGLKRHQRSTHCESRPFSCTPCGASFKLRCDLTKHRRKFHGAEEGRRSTRLKCRFCSKWFPVTSKAGGEAEDDRRLAEHQRQQHMAGQRPFPCELCDTVFRNFKALNAHQVVHHKDRPFGCSGCRKAFGRKSHLTRHQQNGCIGPPSNVVI